MNPKNWRFKAERYYGYAAAVILGVIIGLTLAAYLDTRIMP